MTCVGHNTCLRRPQHCDLCQPQHLFTSATIPVYVGHNTTYLRRPKHLFTSAKTLVYVSHNTSHLHPQKYWPAPATTQVTTLACVKKNTCLRRPQHRPVSVKILACVNNYNFLCWPEHWPASVKILACAGHNSKNSDLRRPQQ